MTSRVPPLLRPLQPATVQDVRAMYQAFPYPSPTAGDSLIGDVGNCLYTLFGDDALAGQRILDAGCGTGHRALAVARKYPRAQLLGLDMTPASLDVARTLAARHRIDNVEFRVGDLLELSAHAPFDIVICVGVVHHLEDPGLGLRKLASVLGDRGILIVWHYHSLGEHQRLLDRELLLTMWDRATGFERGLALMQGLGLKLETKRYGSTAAQADSEISQRSIDVDAYLHPIVRAYRFEEAMRMFSDCGHLGWAAVNNLNFPGRSKLVDLGEVEQGDLRCFCQSVEELFCTSELRERFRTLNALEKLRVLELVTRPTGFTIVGGRGDSYKRLQDRARGNVVAL